jgi:TctA family transporter
VFKKIAIPLAPFTLALVLGSRAEDSFRLAMIGAGGDMRVFWSNGLVGSITTLALILLFWPLISSVAERLQSAFSRDMKSVSRKKVDETSL